MKKSRSASIQVCVSRHNNETDSFRRNYGEFPTMPLISRGSRIPQSHNRGVCSALHYCSTITCFGHTPPPHNRTTARPACVPVCLHHHRLGLVARSCGSVSPAPTLAPTLASLHLRPSPIAASPKVERPNRFDRGPSNWDRFRRPTPHLGAFFYVMLFFLILFYYSPFLPIKPVGMELIN